MIVLKEVVVKITTSSKTEQNEVNENLQQLSKDLLLQKDTENKKVQDDEIDYDDPAQEKWLQLRMRLILHTIIDNDIQRNVNIEKERWRNNLKRIIACIEFLAEHNDAFRGTSSKLYTANNGPRIQNELINIIATKIRDEIINRVRQSKYFTILINPDKGHKEQLTFLLRVIEISKVFKYEINEYFICFIHTTSKTGLNLTEEKKAQLKLMNIDLNNFRGQAYDNGANMIGHHQGVQSRILSKNLRDFFVPCIAHSLNLLLGDIALSVPAAMTFFGVIQRICSIFSGSTERWTILLKYDSDFTLKPMSDTRWESRVGSIKPIRFQLCQVHDALIEISESTKDPKIKSESSSLANYEICYDFILSVVIWYELLSAINKVNSMSKLAECRSNSGLCSKEFVWDSLKTRTDGTQLSPIIWWNDDYSEASMKEKKIFTSSDSTPTKKKDQTECSN
ncbi:zinc finger MYM-type protein 1-like [Daktulosphaira vitifoliae]|uniref:zinc finger MYM-type protein 1-like n=1 Tax=Daktulosphaira vitifoliae TaxID=58002 RepID=UPI0021AA22EC|nr:zinc finger MYM-type protein 1-like [Daktulosphaira vitifoliae]